MVKGQPPPKIDPESYLAHVILQGVLHFGGQLEESVTAAELALAMSGRLSWSVAFLAVTFADLGKREDADALYAELVARARRQYMSPAQLALAAAAAGIEDQAIRHARTAFKIRDPDCQIFLSPHLRYSALLYEYPRFRELLAHSGRSDWLRA